jgi:ankyrin repeat protein
LSGVSTTSFVSHSSNDSNNHRHKRGRTRGRADAAHQSPQPHEPYDWFRSVSNAVQSGRWESLREMLTLRSQISSNNQTKHNSHNKKHHAARKVAATPESPRRKLGFWRRIVGVAGADGDGNAAEHSVFLQQDKDGRTPLHVALTHSQTPTDILLLLLQVEPGAAAIPNAKGRFPLHTAVWYGHHIEAIAELVEAHPAAIGTTDGRGQTPLAYAMATAIQQTHLEQAPSSFWMPATPRLEGDDDDMDDEEEQSNQARNQSVEAKWQETAVERWAVVHWLLLASATYPQTSLTVGGQKPMLVEALVFAAPPAVVSLLIGASVVLLSYESRASAFAGTTLYTCIARQYPLPILMSLALQCPKDVRSVADETGMGLIAAQFVVGCFQRRNDATEEWALVEDVWMAIQETIQEGQLPDEAVDPALCDLWAKIEFLIAFCAPSSQNTKALSRASKSHKRAFLLHQAVTNPDVPPTVLRLLLALHPETVYVPAPAGLGPTLEGARALHLVARTPEYLPRNYELPIMTSENALDIVLEADPNAAWEPHLGRLPLHWALAASKPYSAIRSLVDLDPDRALHTPDPVTLLYPFLLAAYTYGVNGLGRLPKEWKTPKKGDEESDDGDDEASTKLYLMWTRMARNQYTHYVWKGLSERQKASAVYRVMQGQSLKGLSTIWQLLLRTPDLVPVSPFRRVPTNSARDYRGVGTVANHYLMWCYGGHSGGRTAIAGDSSLLNEEKWEVLREAIRSAPNGGLESLDSDFEKWYNKMRFWIRYCCPANPAVRRGNAKSLRVDPRWDCPSSDDGFLLHMAVMNPDTPPAVINLLLGAAPNSVTCPIPKTSFLPLHIACRTPSYVPRFFEAPYHSSILILTRVYPEATTEKDDDGKLPLHRAIESRKAWSEIEILVLANPSSLVSRTPDSKLFPFQLMALPRPETRIRRLNHMYKARNQVEASVWESYSAVEKVKAVRGEARKDHLETVSTIFELLRRNVSMIEPSSPNEDTCHDRGISVEDSMDSSESTLHIPGLNVTSHDSHLEGSEVPDTLTENDTIVSGMGSAGTGTDTWADGGRPEERKASASTGPTDDNDSGSGSSLDSFLPHGQEPSALMSFLSNHERTQSTRETAKEQNVFECDTSVLSNVDVLSTLSSTLHSTIHSTFHPPTGPGRRYSAGGRPSSEHGRVSEGGDESASREGHGEESSSDSDSSGSEFGADSSAYLSFAIGGSSGHRSLEDDGISLPSTDSYARSFASTGAKSVSENSDLSSSSPVHFKLRRKQRVEYWEDRETMDQVQVSRPNLQLRTDDISSVYSATSSAKRSAQLEQLALNQSAASLNSSASSLGQKSLQLNDARNAESPMNRSASVRSMKSMKSQISSAMESYSSLTSRDLMQNNKANMVWVPQQLVAGKLLGGNNSSQDFEESLQFSPRTNRMHLNGSGDVSLLESPSKNNSSSLGSSIDTEFEQTFHEASEESRVPEEELDIKETDYDDSSNAEGSSNKGDSPRREASRKNSKSSPNASDSSRGEVPRTKSTEMLRRLMVPFEEESESEFGPQAEDDDNNKSESSIRLDDVFQKNLSQRSKQSTKPVRSESSRRLQKAQHPSSKLDPQVPEGRKQQQSATAPQADDTSVPIPNGAISEAAELSTTEPSVSTSSDLAQDLRNPPTTETNHPDESEGKDDAEQDMFDVKNQESTVSTESSAQILQAEVKTVDANRATGKTEAKSESREIVYFDRVEMRWKKKKADEVKPAPEPVPTPEAEPEPNESKEEPAPAKKKEMYFDRKSMRWKVREATGENTARNMDTGLGRIDENRESTQHSLTRRVSKPGSPFVELASKDTMATKGFATTATTKLPPKRSIKVNLGNIPERRAKGKSPSLLASKNMLCLLCSKNRREVLLKPCQHLSICRTCSRHYKEIAMCPLCEGAVTDRMLIF